MKLSESLSWWSYIESVKTCTMYSNLYINHYMKFDFLQYSLSENSLLEDLAGIQTRVC